MARDADSCAGGTSPQRNARGPLLQSLLHLGIGQDAGDSWQSVRFSPRGTDDSLRGIHCLEVYPTSGGFRWMEAALWHPRRTAACRLRQMPGKSSR
jgi:hypothetical protein